MDEYVCIVCGIGFARPHRPGSKPRFCHACRKVHDAGVCKAWTVVNKERAQKNMHDWYVRRKRDRKEARATSTQRWRNAHPDAVRAHFRKWAATAKRMFMAAYGPDKRPDGRAQCCCCGESRIEVLTADHIAGDGSRRRRAGEPAGKDMYSRARAMGYPEELGVRTLCMTCQWLARFGRLNAACDCEAFENGAGI